MLGQLSASRSTAGNDRIFIYEVAGLAENAMTANNQTPIRSSDNQLIQVPLSRMNETMRRITRLGGRIVDIRPLAAAE
ncbi:MAG: phycobilisome linker polypeptide [Leptolyngbyaceae cyanobacterium]